MAVVLTLGMKRSIASLRAVLCSGPALFKRGTFIGK
jgi:hypothetical protein